jgi:hypothetical protein
VGDDGALVGVNDGDDAVTKVTLRMRLFQESATITLPAGDTVSALMLTNDALDPAPSIDAPLLPLLH